MQKIPKYKDKRVTMLPDLLAQLSVRGVASIKPGNQLKHIPQ